MKILLALRDVKTGAFLEPMVATTPGEAERLYSMILRNERLPLIHEHQNDFPLYELGKYDEQTGQVYPLFTDAGVVAPPRLMLEAAQLIQLAKEA